MALLSTTAFERKGGRESTGILMVTSEAIYLGVCLADSFSQLFKLLFYGSNACDHDKLVFIKKPHGGGNKITFSDLLFVCSTTELAAKINFFIRRLINLHTKRS